MSIHYRAIRFTPIFFVTSLGLFSPIAGAFDSGDQALNGAVGATDYFKVSCAGNEAGDTDHFNFKVIDTTLEATGTPSVYKQVINATINKDGVFQKKLSIVAGDKESIELPLGMGKYEVYFDTNGTDQTLIKKNKYLIKKQYFTLSAQCLNSDGEVVKKPKNLSKNVPQNKIKKFKMKCSKDKKLADPYTEKLTLSISNTSPILTNSNFTPLPVLNAQVTRIDKGKTLNASDLAGDDEYSPELNLAAGNGDYFISVDNTATVQNADSEKQYAFQYRCLNANNEETATGLLTKLQDQ